MEGRKKKVCSSIILVILTVMIAVVLPYSFYDYYISANTVDTSEAAYKALEDKLAKIQQSKKENQAKLNNAENDLLTELQTKKLIDDDLEWTRQEIEIYNSLYIQLNNKIDANEYETQVLEQDIEAKYETFLQNMRHSYEEGNVNLLEVVLGSGSIPEFIMNVEYAGSLLNYQQKFMKELNAQSESLHTVKSGLEQDQADALAMKEKMIATEAELEKKASTSANFISQYRTTISSAETALDQNAAEEEKINQQLESIIVERERQKALAKTQTYYSGSGTLSWPADSKNNKISSGYGPRVLNGRSEFHRGIDIPVKFNDNVYASASGEVVTATSHSSYGNYVMIDHGLYNGVSLYTLYAHNSSLAVKVGDHVEEGQIIAYGGSTGYSTGNHIHFEVRENGVTVDPVAKGYVSAP